MNKASQTYSVEHDPELAVSMHVLNRFLLTVHEQDDFALVLSLATFIEEALGRLLLAYFRDCKATRELIEGFNAPLGTLSSRIKAVFSFGLVTEDQYKDMEILRKIRNKHAHSWEGVSLEDADIKALIGQLSGYTLDPRFEGSVGRARLQTVLTTICMELQTFLYRLQEGKAAKAPEASFRIKAFIVDESVLGKA